VHFFFLLIILTIGKNSLCSSVWFLYPKEKSFEAIEGRKRDEVMKRKEVTQWLIYWVVYSLFEIIEVFVDFYYIGYHFITHSKWRFYHGWCFHKLEERHICMISFWKTFWKKTNLQTNTLLNSLSTKHASTYILESKDQRVDQEQYTPKQKQE